MAQDSNQADHVGLTNIAPPPGTCDLASSHGDTRLEATKGVIFHVPGPAKEDLVRSGQHEGPNHLQMARARMME
ncbi:uncharacterized protein MAM_03149 [Metarhizium album ARSEF 1941]|uniref:Uncharacterized protein n=1 Tax=Metarhizium album (strain ARSEF 1941) TaxID=1081103 RepID=A0A0B2WZ22_METAS|nr:uncharacterized protein MAM_03149 [Metarhizium album ARSEF 1941]KHN98687.1 hypothetical protein MAM_03149 [Metarhizium album ARSEF 1941]